MHADPARPHVQRHTSLRAIVLGVEHPRALAVIRSLGRIGVRIVAIDHEPGARGFYSRFVDQAFVVGRERENAYHLLRSLGPQGGGLLVPTNDHYLAMAAEAHHELTQWYTLTTPPWEVLQRLTYKPACYALAREVDVHTPAWFAPTDLDQLDTTIAVLDFDRDAYIIGLPEQTSPAIADVSTGRKTRAAPRDAASFRAAYLEIHARTGTMPTIFQVVPGEARTSIGVSMVVDRQHEAHAIYVVRRLQMLLYRRDAVYMHPYELGANVHCESCHDDEAVTAARRFVRQARYYGPLTLEFRRDARDGRLVLIKADPRVVRATALATALGADIPRTLYAAFTGTASAPAPPYPDGVGWMWLTWYVNAIWRNHAISPMRGEIVRFARALPRVGAWAYLDRGDLLPFVVDVSRWAAKWRRIAGRWARRHVGGQAPGGRGTGPDGARRDRMAARRPRDGSS